MKVVRPTKNNITQGYHSGHKAYDFAGRDLPDEVRAGMSGVVSTVVNLYDTNWLNTGILTTRDYGNYIIIRHDDGTRELHAHLKKYSMFPVGTRVVANQLVARIGNTGNSTGPHLHSEYRNASNLNVSVEFINYTPLPTPLPIPPTNTMTDLEKKKLVQFDRTVNELNKAGYIGSAASEQFFDNPMDEDKFLNLIKRIIRDAKTNSTPVDTAAIKEEGRKLGIKQAQDAVNKLV